MDYEQYQQKNPTEISYQLDVAMPYGKMPNEALIAKFEETADLDDGEDAYDNYARHNLQDRSPDPITLEQDMPRKNYNAGGFLNVRYNGGRGTENSPAHPEMFLGLTEREPRGVALGPDMNKMVEQQNARMRFVRFSADADNSVSQGRWSESEAFHKARYLTHKSIKDRAKIFTTAKDGRREGLRREYYPHKSNVNKVQEDLSVFRPRGSTFSDYVADQGLNPQRKTAKLSDTIITNSNLYNQFTTDHEFKVARYGEDARRRKLTAGRDSRIDTVERESYDDIPGGERVEYEDVAKARKAAGILMGAIVTQKHNAVSDSAKTGIEDMNSESGRKTAILAHDLNVIMRNVQASSSWQKSDATINGKNAAPRQADHLARVQVQNHSKPAHMLHNIELMYRSVQPGANKEKIRRQVHVDDRKALRVEDQVASRRLGRTTAKTGRRDALMEVDGVAMSTPTFKSSRKTTDMRTQRVVAAATEGFGARGDQSQRRRPGQQNHNNPTIDDHDVDATALGVTNAHEHRAFYRGGDKYGAHRNSTLSEGIGAFA